jgi:hypothetical protein
VAASGQDERYLATVEVAEMKIVETMKELIALISME